MVVDVVHEHLPVNRLDVLGRAQDGPAKGGVLEGRGM